MLPKTGIQISNVVFLLTPRVVVESVAVFPFREFPHLSFGSDVPNSVIPIEYKNTAINLNVLSVHHP
jgi:hypothetical protein